MHVSAFTPRQCSFVTYLGTWRVRIYPHASALTTRVWDNIYIQQLSAKYFFSIQANLIPQNGGSTSET